MEIQRKLLLMFLCMAAANSLPSLFDDSDNQNLNSDSSVSPELGTVSSEPPDFTNLYANDDEFPLISGNIALADPGLDGATSLFQDLPAKDLSGSAAHLEDGDILRSLPAADSSIELAMDDFCPLGYWNRCCHDGYCFWGMFVQVRLNWSMTMMIQLLLKFWCFYAQVCRTCGAVSIVR